MSTLDDVHRDWLAAGAKGDAETMKRLRAQHPQWLDLQRIVGPATTSNSTVSASRFCSWEHFHLSTIGASTLLTAAWDGSVEIIEMLLQAGQDPNTSDNGGLTPMMVSILRYNVLVMRCVFRNGQAVRRNLVVDCREDEVKLVRRILAIVRLLLQFNADVDARNQEGYTALHYAANGDALEIAKALLDADADIDAQDQNGKAPLHQSIREESLLVTNLLVTHGAQIGIEDAGGVTPLTLVLHRRSVNMLQIILNQYHLVATTDHPDFAAFVLFSAVDNDFEDAVRHVVESGYVPATARNAAGETLLHRAIMNSSSSLMELSISLDPTDSSLTATTLKGDTVSHYAARYASVPAIETLLIHLRRRFSHLPTLDEVANPLNAANHKGETCLYTVGINRSSPSSDQDTRDTIARLLLQQGARLSPADCVVGRSNSECGEILLLHTLVRRGLPVWIREAVRRNHEIEIDGNDDNGVIARISDVLLTDLCVEWVASVAFPRSSLGNEDHRLNLTAVLHVGISAGYALELVSLLVELPLMHSCMSALLRQLERFSRSPRQHAVLLQLHLELSEALVELGDN